MDLYRQQAKNRRMTFALMAAFIALFALVGFAADMAFGVDATSSDMATLPLAAIAFSLVSTAVSYFWGDRLVLKSLSARPLDENDLKERQLKNVVEEMAIASGVPMPAIYILPDDDPNALATGRSPDHASLAVTEGLLTAMDREELQAVVAHEMGHIRNWDIRTMMIVSVLAGAIILMADMIMRSGSRGRSRRSKDGNNMLVVIVVALFASVAARFLAMAVSRTREFEADRSAAEFTRNPLALARALAKLEGHKAPTRVATQGTAHLFAVDPRVSELNERKDFFANLFATHPPIKERIERLEEMGYGRVEAS